MANEIRVLTISEAKEHGYSFCYGANNRLPRSREQALDYAGALQRTCSGRDSYAVVDQGQGAYPRYQIFIRDGGNGD